MSDPSFDIIIIGSGPGGYVTAIRAAQSWLNVTSKRPLGETINDCAPELEPRGAATPEIVKEIAGLGVWIATEPNAGAQPAFLGATCVRAVSLEEFSVELVP